MKGQKNICMGIAGLLLCASSAMAQSQPTARLTPDEERWLAGTWPVLLYARDEGLPLDVVVQPQPSPGLPPIALAYIDGRCKFVFSMRGNPEVQATLSRIAPELLDATLELMAAHELGHCRRHVGGAWHALPDGHAQTRSTAMNAQAEQEDRQAVRREEAYADLVGLAWTYQHHRPLYARLHAWLVAERTLLQDPGGAHDTLAWARLATQGERWAGPAIFETANALWVRGLDAAR
ncbi:conserved exported hypothetical protein [Rubrivivax sp. A210]|uniref:hypothetical protein n=1 Tax=Rubrivivax sp. A210 TaxID=2772301 RepID=UPI00191ABEE3|nr:hypothetical protein [Rubrivivax sp. A210]CAD5365926.1 conserved exported hypothetical protein [Rubrivivax sp. A210]